MIVNASECGLKTSMTFLRETSAVLFSCPWSRPDLVPKSEHWAKCVYNKSPFSHVYLWQINNGNCWCTVPCEALQTSCTWAICLPTSFLQPKLTQLWESESTLEYWRTLKCLYTLVAIRRWMCSTHKQLYKNISQPLDLISACHLLESLARNFNSIKIVLLC